MEGVGDSSITNFVTGELMGYNIDAYSCLRVGLAVVPDLIEGGEKSENCDIVPGRFVLSHCQGN